MQRIVKHCLVRAFTGLIILCTASVAIAHGFGPRYSLPIPLQLFVAGAGIIVAVSFAAFAFFVDIERARVAGTPRVVQLSPRAARLTTVLADILQYSIALLFFAVVASGYFGSQYPFRNLLPVLVWILGWVGIAFVCVLATDVWQRINPWATVFGLAERLFIVVSGKDRSSPLYPYPERLGVWPAIVLFLVFAWVELVWPGRSNPAELATVVLAYSAITWAGMVLFGREAWCQHGELFSIIFAAFARFAPFATTERSPAEIVVRWPSAGYLTEHRVSGSMVVFLVALLSTVTFDGILETWVWAALDIWILASPMDSPLWTVFGLREIQALLIARSIGLVLLVLIMLGSYYLICWSMSLIGRKAGADTFELGRYFIFSLVPIAIAYHIAHYFPFLLGGMQYAIPIVSDPLALGWDLFGTTDYRINPAAVNPLLQWSVAITAIVVGHVVSVYVAHIYALRLFSDTRIALLSQIPMVTFMVAYTMLSLWILAQPIT